MWLVIWKCEAPIDLCSLTVIYNPVVVCEYLSRFERRKTCSSSVQQERSSSLQPNPFSSVVKRPKVMASSRTPTLLCKAQAQGKVHSSGNDQRCKCGYRFCGSVLALCSSVSFLLSLIYSLSRHHCQLWPGLAIHIQNLKCLHHRSPRWISGMFSFYKWRPCSERLSNLAQL